MSKQGQADGESSFPEVTHPSILFPGGLTRVEAADNEKVDGVEVGGGASSSHGIGLPLGMEWKCGV